MRAFSWFGSRERGCNRDATVAVVRKPIGRARPWATRAIALAVLHAIVHAAPAATQGRTGGTPAPPGDGAAGACQHDAVSSPRAPAAPPSTGAASIASIARFLAGAGLGLAAHEGGHLAFDYAFGANPGVEKVNFGPFPFFAVTHRPLTPRREFIVASAGFWAQHLGDEILLSERPRLRDERAPLAKGYLAFNVLASVAYAGGALAHVGPPERDTRTMAVFLGVDEAAVGAMVLAPAVLDTLRYYRPQARWATWTSRAVKIGTALLVLVNANERR